MKDQLETLIYKTIERIDYTKGVRSRSPLKDLVDRYFQVTLGYLPSNYNEIKPLVHKLVDEYEA